MSDLIYRPADLTNMIIILMVITVIVIIMIIIMIITKAILIMSIINNGGVFGGRITIKIRFASFETYIYFERAILKIRVL